MPITVNYKEIDGGVFDYPFRILISGSSQCGKTTFAHKLLQHPDIFSARVRQVIYFHPDYLSHRPVEWHDSLTMDVTYRSGMPTLSDLRDLEPYSCIVLDDLYEECINSNAIDYLFRVLSGKKNLSVIILSQRYFASGRFGMNIRNNCNYTVLMRNVDATLNLRVASQLSLKAPITSAIENTYERNYWPYIFIDSTPRGQVSSVRCYIDIFSRIKVAFDQKGMKVYMLTEQDFLANFERLNKTTAKLKNGSNPTKNLRETPTDRDTGIAAAGDSGKECQVYDRIKQRTRELRKRRKTTTNIH